LTGPTEARWMCNLRKGALKRELEALSDRKKGFGGICGAVIWGGKVDREVGLSTYPAAPVHNVEPPLGSLRAGNSGGMFFPSINVGDEGR